MDFSVFIHWKSPFPNLVVAGVFCIFNFISIRYKLANSVDPDQTPRSDLGLHCLCMSHLWNVWYIWVNSTLPLPFTLATI